MQILNSTFGKVSLSVLTALVIFVLGRLWRDVLKPLLESAIYSGTKLAANYVGEFTFEGKKVHDYVEVKQWAKKVWGTMTVPDGAGDAKFKFHATINENVLRGTYEGVKKTPRAHGSFLMTLTPGAEHFEGAFIQPYKTGLIYGKYTWSPHGVSRAAFASVDDK